MSASARAPSVEPSPLEAPLSTTAGLQTLGDTALLERPPRGLLCSRNVPPDLVLPVLRWAAGRGREAIPILSGFHSPLERACLSEILGAGGRVVVALARRLEGYSPPREVRGALDAGAMLIVSGENRLSRATLASAWRRNRLVGSMAGSLVVVHAPVASGTFAVAREVARERGRLESFEHPANLPLFVLGAAAIPLESPW